MSDVTTGIVQQLAAKVRELEAQLAAAEAEVHELEETASALESERNELNRKRAAAEALLREAVDFPHLGLPVGWDDRAKEVCGEREST